MTFITLTTVGGSRVRYRAELIMSYWRNSDESYTRFIHNDRSVSVRETPEEIDQLLERQEPKQ